MGIFTRIADRMERQSNLMHGMMQRLDVSLEGAATEAAGARLEAAARRCLMCRDSDACQHWLDGGADTAPDFCPNARFFTLHRK